MAFFQVPPTLGNQYSDDRVLRSYLARVLGDEALRSLTGDYEHLGALAGGELYVLQQRDRLREPELTHWDPWGHRVDHIEVTELWKRAAVVAAEHGVVAAGYEATYGAHARVDQFTRVYLFSASTDVYTCPLAMTDGAARTLLAHGNQALIERAVPRLTSRDPAFAWTSGQWMTERTGGSDVGLSETIARRDGDQWRLHGTKWFTSATTSQMALTLARPEGNPAGGRGLALFYVEPRDEHGRLTKIAVNRLKDKLGTRKVPTAELTLDGAPATLVNGTADGVRAISPMLNVTRTWNALCAIATMRRGIALARDYARRRVAFGATLAEKPLHADTLAGLQAEFEAGFHLAFRAVALLGREEHGELQGHEGELLRVITPLAKLTTGRQVVAVTSECLEAFGGAGYVEDTGLPTLLRDAQVLPIWEGTTNVLSLDVLRAMGKGDVLRAVIEEVRACTDALTDARLAALGAQCRAAVAHAAEVARRYVTGGHATVGLARMEADARRFSLTLGRTLAAALLVHHAQWSLEHEGDGRARAAAARFVHHGIDLLDADYSLDENAALANDTAI
jgi:alkylation response protein AidB-like acyl-CoA dehydrogenase